MWKSVKNGKYVFKRYDCDENAVKLVVSDFVHAWVKEIGENELLGIFQEQNPLLELHDEFNSQNIWTIVDEHLESSENKKNSSCSLDINVMDDLSLHFKFFSRIDCLAFKLNLLLVQENPHIFFDEVTRPLLSLANVLLAQREQLCALLEKKDLEIAEYKLEGATVSRKNVQTQPFTKSEFINCYKDCGRNLSDGLGRVIDILNSLSQSNESNIPDKPTDVNSVRTESSSKTPTKIEAHAIKVQSDVKVLKEPKKKRTKLNL